MLDETYHTNRCLKIFQNAFSPALLALPATIYFSLHGIFFAYERNSCFRILPNIGALFIMEKYVSCVSYERPDMVTKLYFFMLILISSGYLPKDSLHIVT